MKRVLPVFLGIIIIFLLFLSLRLPPFTFAGCTPPDYSDCSIARTGPKIAGNIDTRNYEQIREAYNTADPAIANQWIPVTIIYTVEDLHPEHFQDTKGNLEAMKANGLLPIIRIWDSTDVQGSRIAGETLNQLFQAVTFPEQIVYPFNEPNLPDGPYQADPRFFAEALSAFIQGAGVTPNYKIYFPPIAGHQGGYEYEFAEEVLSYQMPDGRTIAQAIDAAAFTIYQWEPGQFEADLDNWVNLLRGYGVNEFIISELGPYDYNRPDRPLLQNIGDLETWKAKMSEIFARIKSDPSFLGNASLINTSFFLDINGDGKADITLLVVIHADGTVEILELLYYGGGFGWDMVYQFPACIDSSSITRVSRPDECSTCDLNPPLTWSCAETFSVNDTVSWKRHEFDFECGGSPWVEEEWGGTIAINPNEVTVPFVGKKDAEDVKEYLADYFEGTAFYYGPDVDLEDCKIENPNEAERKACQEEVKRITAEGGVFRKLAPREWQDKLKKEMIDRAQKSKTGEIENGIHDYLIQHAGYQMRLSTIIPPPDSPQARKDWEETPSGKLWPAVPMFSREDSPGEIIAQVNTKSKDKVGPSNPVSKVDQVPHLARLFEVTQKLQELLMPWIEEEQTKAPSKTLLASSDPSVLGEKTYLAQADFPYGCKWLYGDWPDDCSCLAAGNCRGEHGGCCPPHPGWGPICGWEDCQVGPGTRCESPPANDCPAAVVIGGPSAPPAPSCPPPPSCGLADPCPSFKACDFESITDDENPNDTICCDPINIELSAIEQFKNEKYTPCPYPVFLTRRLEPDHPCLKQGGSEKVSRQVKVELYHPYLDEIWEQTTDSFRGLFNIFRPDIEPPFRDLHAHSYISYSFNGEAEPIDPDPPWKFYFPHLGGIQEAKDWVLQTLNPLGEGERRPPGLAAPVGSTTLDYTLPFRDSTITISDEAKAYVIQKVKNNVSWANTKIESHWDYVYSQAVSHGWNPAFVIALWIEESGASAVSYAYDLGCEGAAKGDLESQLDCLFSRPYANTPFKEFMCTYATGHYPCFFEGDQAYFPGNVKVWYMRLRQ